MVQSIIMITVIHALILLWWCVRQMRMVQSGIMIVVIHALILPCCVRQMRMVQIIIMITVIHSLMLIWCVRQTPNEYGSELLTLHSRRCECVKRANNNRSLIVLLTKQ